MEQNLCKRCGLDMKDCNCKKMGKWLLILLAGFLVLYIGITHAVKIYSSYTNPRTVVISGKGEVNAVPDISVINFTVRSSSDTKDTQKLQNDVKGQVDNVLSKIKSFGIADKDIKTEYYQVNPKYGSQACPAVRTMIYPSTPCETSKVVGYEASESISVKVRNTDNSGKVLAALADAKITEVSGPSFQIDDPEKLKNEARDKAIKDAKEKAKVLAKSLGIELSRIISYSDDNGGAVYPMMYAKAMDSSVSGSAESATLPTGEQKITSNVSITFQIED